MMFSSFLGGGTGEERLRLRAMLKASFAFLEILICIKTLRKGADASARFVIYLNLTWPVTSPSRDSQRDH